MSSTTWFISLFCLFLTLPPSALCGASDFLNNDALDEQQLDQEEEINYGANNYSSSAELLARGIFQPKVTRIEKNGATKAIGSISMAKGSPWCENGRPMVWLVGHQHPDYPWCLDPDGTWRRNFKSGFTARTDRHDCVHLDVNKDGIDDIVCLVGAKKGRGYGLNELYLTRKDTSLVKVKSHGLQQYKSLSTRVAAKLNHANGGELIFIGTSGRDRKDRKTNAHRMFVNLKTGLPPYFRELAGPWREEFSADCAVTADVNNDSLDDLIVCSRQGTPRMYVQNSRGLFNRIKIPSSKRYRARNWRSVRVGHIDGDNIPDLVVVEGWWDDKAYYLRVFRGIQRRPYFYFKKPSYSTKLRFAASDIEILDVNSDGHSDIFVIQANERKGYCSERRSDVAVWPGKANYPRKSWVPPRNGASHLLLVGTGSPKGRTSFSKVPMKFHENGCGYLVERFGDMQTVIFAGGRRLHAGYQYLLEWGKPNKNAASRANTPPLPAEDPSDDGEVTWPSAPNLPSTPEHPSDDDDDDDDDSEITNCKKLGMICSGAPCCSDLVCEDVGRNNEGNVVQRCKKKA